MKLSSHTSPNATNMSLRGITFVILTLRTVLPAILTLCGTLPVILTLSKTKGKNLRTIWHSIRNNTRGVTLIEMLVALVITALIVSSVYVAFDSGTKSWQVGDTMMQRYQNARGALDMMSREIPTAIVNAAGTIYCIGKEDAFYFTGVLKSVNVDVDSLNVADDLYRAGYWWESSTENGEKPGVVQRGFEGRESADYYTFAGLSNNPLAVHAVSLTFRYYSNDNSWLPVGDWDEGIISGTTDNSNKLPAAIEIKLTTEDDHATASRIFTTVVKLPNAE